MTAKKKKSRTSQRTSQRNKADRLFSLIVRSRGYCEAATWKDGIKCGGNLQCAHIIGRARYAIRWDEDNALCLCAGHHTWYTHHPEEWYVAIHFWRGAQWSDLLWRTRQPWDKDYSKVLERLEARAKFLGIK